MSDFEVRPIDLSPEGVAQTCELLNVVFPDAQHIDIGYLDRLFHGNPLGPAGGFSAFQEDTLVGHYLMIPVKTRLFGKEEDGIWPFQFATHPDYRLKGLFSALVIASIEGGRAQGYKHLVGVANAQSSPILREKFGFQTVGQLDVKIGIGPIPKRKPRSDVELTRIWNQAQGVAWRCGHPPTSYTVKYRGDIGHLHADTGKYGLPVEIGSFPRDLLPESLSPLRTPNPLRMWIGIDCERNWSGTMYFDLPERFKPVPLNLTFLDLTDENREIDLSKAQYDVFDFDAY